jgi:hypothetical protein
MSIGIALVFIFVLYLIDKHSRWRQLAKITLGFILLCVLAGGGWYGYDKYDDYRTVKAQEKAVAETEARAAKAEADLVASCKAWEDKHPLSSLDQYFPLPDVNGKPQFNKNDAPWGCDGPLEDAYENRMVKLEMESEHGPWEKYRSTKPHQMSDEEFEKKYGASAIAVDPADLAADSPSPAGVPLSREEFRAKFLRGQARANKVYRDKWCHGAFQPPACDQDNTWTDADQVQSDSLGCEVSSFEAHSATCKDLLSRKHNLEDEFTKKYGR